MTTCDTTPFDDPGPCDPAGDIAVRLATAAGYLADAVEADRPGWLAIAREVGDLLAALVTARLDAEALGTASGSGAALPGVLDGIFASFDISGAAGLYTAAAELSATAGDIAADIAEGRNCPDHVARARRLLDILAADIGEQGSLAEFADTVTVHLGEHFGPEALPLYGVLNLAEEAGEFAGAYRRWAGMARRPGTWDDVCAELADVVITAHVTARVLGIDLDAAWRAKAAVVLSRGWREQAPEATP